MVPLLFFSTGFRLLALKLAALGFCVMVVTGWQTLEQPSYCNQPRRLHYARGNVLSPCARLQLFSFYVKVLRRSARFPAEEGLAYKQDPRSLLSLRGRLGLLSLTLTSLISFRLAPCQPISPAPSGSFLNDSGAIFKSCDFLPRTGGGSLFECIRLSGHV